MKKLRKNKRGAGAVIIVGLISLFIVAMVYSVMAGAWEKIYDTTNPLLNDTNAQATQNKIYTTWYYWPILMIISIILWVIYNSIRRDTGSGFT